MTPPTESVRDVKRPNRLTLLIGSAVAIVCLGAGAASAQTTDEAVEPEAPATTDALEETGTAEATPDEATAEPADQEATDEPAADAEPKAQRGSRLRLVKEDVNPQKVYFDGMREAKFEYKFTGSRTADLTIEVMKVRDGGDELIRRYSRNNREQDKLYTLRWNGNRANGDPVRTGKLYFQVKEAGAQRLKREHANGDRTFKVFPAIFPVRGKHQYWDGFGAGRGHQGQDVGADCGTRMVAAEPGKVEFKGYDGGGYGYYLIIDVRGANRSEVYGHLQRPASVKQGSKVKTGEKVGRVGDTGNASGCHLHFEYRPNDSPSAIVTKRLKKWDRYS